MQRRRDEGLQNRHVMYRGKNVKGKGKICLGTCHEGPVREEKYSSNYSFMFIRPCIILIVE